MERKVGYCPGCCSSGLSLAPKRGMRQDIGAGRTSAAAGDDGRSENMAEVKQLLIHDEPPPGSNESHAKLCWKPPRRYQVAFLSFLGFLNIYTLRINLSVAITKMEEEIPEYHAKKGIILAAFFYGYIVTQIPGGWIAKKYGGKKLLGISVVLTSILCIITPLLATNYKALLAVRVLQGLAEGTAYPSMHSVWAKWAPAPERSRLATISFSGSYIGTVVAMFFSGIIAGLYGWKFVFYIFGIVSMLWAFFWLWNVGEEPSVDAWITQKEKDYINSSIGIHDGITESETPLPWRHMLRSKPVWAISIAHFAENWGFYTLVTLLPSYLKETLGATPIKTGFISSLPYLLLAILIQFAGQLADQLLNYKSTTFVRKLFTCSAFAAQTICILVAGQLHNSQGHQTSTIVFLIMAISVGGFSWAGFSVNHLDISLSWASVLMGISNTFGTIPGMISPILAASGEGLPEWGAVFTVSAVVYLIGAVFYGLLASGEEQEWARRQFNIDESDDSNDESD